MQNEGQIHATGSWAGKRAGMLAAFVFWQLACLLTYILLVMPAQAQSQMVEVSQVRAAYLYNFVKFVEWPPVAYQSVDAPAVICIVGDARTSSVLELATLAKKANGRRVEARQPRSANEFKSCHVLFIGFSDKPRISAILRSVKDSNVLTIGQTDGFISLGGMINLVEKDGNIGLEIDPKATEEAGLKVSSRLLVISRIVNGPFREGGPQ
jgi:hypothetical protein